MNNKTRPALIGGLIVGLLSAIPILNFGNCCCCMWALLGGGYATYLYQKNSTLPVTAGDGAVVGGMAGIVGAAIYFVIGVPLGLLTNNVTVWVLQYMATLVPPKDAAQLQTQIELMKNQSIMDQLPMILLLSLLFALILIIFSVIGGALAIPLMGKGGNMNPPPPPPPDFRNETLPNNL
jgi:hypothetical protein